MAGNRATFCTMSGVTNFALTVYFKVNFHLKFAVHTDVIVHVRGAKAFKF